MPFVGILPLQGFINVDTMGTYFLCTFNYQTLLSLDNLFTLLIYSTINTDFYVTPLR